MGNAEEVALYAILLREAAANRHLSEAAIFDDMACDEDAHICFATYLALAHFSELDWQMVDVLCNYPREIAEVAAKLYEAEQILEAEALLHAALPNGKKSRAKWAEPLRERWTQVRDSMRAYEREYIAMSMADVQRIAVDTFKHSFKEAITDDDIFQFFFAADEHAERREADPDYRPAPYQPTPGFLRIARAVAVADEDAV
jgi:hypothetical protein